METLLRSPDAPAHGTRTDACLSRGDFAQFDTAMARIAMTLRATTESPRRANVPHADGLISTPKSVACFCRSVNTLTFPRSGLVRSGALWNRRKVALVASLGFVPMAQPAQGAAAAGNRRHRRHHLLDHADAAGAAGSLRSVQTERSIWENRELKLPAQEGATS
jgi:hypothetical protein